ncbi:unnamed protein product [Phytophthora fragariaefolia]|uniref:Unnamed protein product n=1 Tax=Phytophthora fragariaefolia TaxID=1490495 RepID=A0A9W6Y1C0_9STRA|nr:unnamed protein product [Phytophthora fragariaefolia]
MEALRKRLGGAHHFTTPYCPWINGTVEVVNRQLLRCLKALLSELKLPQHVWPTALPVVVHDIHAVVARQGAHIAVQASLPQLQRTFVDTAARRRAQVRARQGDRTGTVLANFDVGAFVLAARVVPHSNKLAVAWQGPKRVVRAIMDYIYEVQDTALPFALTTYHASRLRYDQDGLQGVTQDLDAHALTLPVATSSRSTSRPVLVCPPPPAVDNSCRVGRFEPGGSVEGASRRHVAECSGAITTLCSSSSGGSPRPTDVDVSPCPDIGIEVEASWTEVHARLLLVLSLHMADAPEEVTGSVGCRIDIAECYLATPLVSNALQFGFDR